MSKEYKERKKRTIHNQRIHVRPIGYCHCDAHIGYVTVELMRKHKCLEKGCTFFEVFKDHPYWKEMYTKKVAARTMRCAKQAYLSGELSLKQYNKYCSWYKRGASTFVDLMCGTLWYKRAIENIKD